MTEQSYEAGTPPFPTRGYLRSPGGSFSSIDFPGAQQTILDGGINNLGQIVGRYFNGSAWHGFLDTAGSFTAFDPPGSTTTAPVSINDFGNIAGWFQDSTGKFHGFLLATGPTSKRVIDDFSCSQTANSVKSCPGVLGGVRSLGVTTSGGAASVSVTGGALSASYTSCAGCSVGLGLGYSGPPPFSGFPPTDFTADGADSIRIVATTGASQAPLTVRIVVASGPENASQAVVTIPPGSTSQNILAQYTAFTPVPGFSPADFKNVTAVGWGLQSTSSFSLQVTASTRRRLDGLPRHGADWKASRGNDKK